MEAIVDGTERGDGEKEVYDILQEIIGGKKKGRDVVAFSIMGDHIISKGVEQNVSQKEDGDRGPRTAVLDNPLAVSVY